MSADVEAVMQAAADAAGGVLSSLGKRPNDGSLGEGESEPKVFKADGPLQTSAPPITIAPITTTDASASAAAITAPSLAAADDDEEDVETNEDFKDIDRPPMTKAREVRLDQNRKAARDSRRRKKVMIEELQRSVIFFSRANGTLKQQNDELSRLLMQAQNQAAAADSTPGQPVELSQPSAASAPQTTAVVKAEGEQASNSFQQAQAQAVATQAMFESQGFPAAAARAAAQTMNASAPAEAPETTAAAPAAVSQSSSLPPMQPGATMQAMANFQQAAAAAMQAAIQGMQGNPGVNMNQLAATPVGANPQQAYTDTMTALAMQQAAAAAAAGQQFVMQPGMQFMAHPMIAWQQQQQQQQQAQQTQQPPQILQQAPAEAAAPAPQQQPEQENM
jgi:hypothetical protein